MKFETLTHALEAVAQIKARAREASAAIFHLKQDETISEGDFAVRRMTLNGVASAAEDELRTVEQWIKEERARQEAVIIIEKESRAAKARADRLANEEAKAKLDSDRRAAKEEGWRRDDGNQRRANVRLREALRLAVAAMTGRCDLLRARRLIVEAFPEILDQIDRMGIPVVLEPSWLGKQKALEMSEEPVAERPAAATVADGKCRAVEHEGWAWHSTIVAAVAREREVCAQLAEQCSGGDAEISPRYLIAQRIRARTTPPIGDLEDVRAFWQAALVAGSVVSVEAPAHAARREIPVSPFGDITKVRS